MRGYPSAPGKGYAFHRRHRLTSPEFAIALKYGRKLRGQAVAVLVQANELDWGRLGVVVPKKIVARAVDRNRYKRLFREWFRKQKSCLKGNDWIIRLQGSAEAQDDALIVELERLVGSRAW